MNVCFVAEYGVKIGGGGRSLLSLMLLLKEKFGVRPFLVCHKKWDLINEVKKYNIESCVIPCYTFAYIKKNVSIFTYLKYPIKRFVNSIRRKQIIDFLKTNKIQLVHLNSTISCVEWAIAAQKANVPYIWHIREYLDEDHNRFLMGKQYHYSIIKKSNAIITISNDVCSYWSKKLKYNCTLVYNGFEVNKYYQSATNKLFNDVINCVIVGRIVDGKRQLDAVKAIEILIANNIKNIHLAIIGYRGINNCEKELMEYVTRHNLGKYVEVIDFQDNLASFFSKSDIGLMCSTREAFGRVTIEYMISGLLCIGSNTGGTLELIEDGKTGLLYEMGKPESLAQKLEWVLNNRNESARILLNGQQDAMDKFSIDRTAQEIYSIYTNILNK